MNISRWFSVFIFAATVYVGSCVVQAADSPDLVDTGVVRVEDANGRPLTDVHVHQEEERMAVWGTFTASPLPRHVDVMVLTAERQVITETQVVPTVIRRTHTRRVLWRFDAKLPVTASQGTIVKITSGFGPHDTAQSSAADGTDK